jgi:hypothetical protein
VSANEWLGEAPAGQFSRQLRCPLHTRKWTFAVPKRKSALGQKRTHAAQQKDRYSMTSSAAISKPGGTVKPSAFAVLRLTTVSYFVGVCTGRSAGFAPRRMRST